MKCPYHYPSDGLMDGLNDGDSDALMDGLKDADGDSDGDLDGLMDGLTDALKDGDSDGDGDGRMPVETLTVPEELYKAPATYGSEDGRTNVKPPNNTKSPSLLMDTFSVPEFLKLTSLAPAVLNAFCVSKLKPTADEPFDTVVLYRPPLPISPVVSAIVTPESCINLPVVPSNLTIALSVLLEGPVANVEANQVRMADSNVFFVVPACTTGTVSAPSKGSTEGKIENFGII